MNNMKQGYIGAPNLLSFVAWNTNMGRHCGPMIGQLAHVDSAPQCSRNFGKYVILTSQRMRPSGIQKDMKVI
jgi:hypothetical protein